MRILSILVVFLFSCRGGKELPKTVSSDTDSTTISKEVVFLRDTVIFIPGETIVVKDYTICDSLNRAQMPKKTVKAGRLTATIETKDGRTEVNCHEDSLIAVNAKMKETIRSLESRVSSVDVKQPEAVNYLTWWQRVLCWIGAGALLYIVFKIGVGLPTNFRKSP